MKRVYLAGPEVFRPDTAGQQGNEQDASAYPCARENLSSAPWMPWHGPILALQQHGDPHHFLVQGNRRLRHFPRFLPVRPLAQRK